MQIPDVISSLDAFGDFYVFEIRNETGNKILVTRKVRVPIVVSFYSGKKALIDILEEFGLKAIRIEKGDIGFRNDWTPALEIVPGYIVYTIEKEPEDPEDTPF